MSKSRINRGINRRAELREQAKALQEERASRSPQNQLKILDSRLGVNIGATKEREKLQVLINIPKVKKKADKVKPKKQVKK
jgi:hypothetical protein